MNLHFPYGMNPARRRKKKSYRNTLNPLLRFGSLRLIYQAFSFLLSVHFANELCRKAKGFGVPCAGNLTDTNGKTALSWATELGSEEMVNVLLKAGAYPNVKDSAGLTPLMYATLVGNGRILSTLIQAGADVNTVDLRGSTALVYAKKASQKNLIEILENAGVKK